MIRELLGKAKDGVKLMRKGATCSHVGQCETVLIYINQALSELDEVCEWTVTKEGYSVCGCQDYSAYHREWASLFTFCPFCGKKIKGLTNDD